MLTEGDASAWTLNVTNQLPDLPDNTSCGEGHFWYGWGGENNTNGSISTVLNVTVFGPAELTFGNCGLDGEVLVYLNRNEIAFAGPDTAKKSVKFDFRDFKDEQWMSLQISIRVSLSRTIESNHGEPYL